MVEPQQQPQEARTWAMLCHLASFLGFVIPSIGSVLGPLVVWLIKKDQYPFVDDQGKEALNFQITLFILMMISAVLIIIGIGILLLLALAVVDLVFTIIAAVKANEGVAYRYPFAFRLVK